MRYEIMLLVESEEGANTVLLEMISNLELGNAIVESGVVLLDGNEVAVYDNKETE